MSDMNWRTRNELLYTLGDGGDPIPTDDIVVWGTWFEKANRSIARTMIDDVVHVATSFTGIDRSRWSKEIALWETTIFGGPHHGTGQRYTSTMSAHVGHDLWCEVARGTLAPRSVPCMEHIPSVEREDAACRTDEATTWLTRVEVSDLIGISEKTLSNYESLGLLHPRRITFADQEQGRFYPGRDHKKRSRRIILYDVLQIIAICRRNAHPEIERRQKRGRLVPELPQFLKSSHAALTDFYVGSGAITLIEFRVRYGYRCKRVACTSCQEHHYGGRWGECRDEDGGTHYRVTRSDGTEVSSELSAPQAWKVAHQREQERLAPILIARDAIVEGRIDVAREISDQLHLDLSVPLRREIDRAIDSPSSCAELGPTAQNNLPMVKVDMGGFR